MNPKCMVNENQCNRKVLPVHASNRCQISEAHCMSCILRMSNSMYEDAGIPSCDVAMHCDSPILRLVCQFALLCFASL